MDDLTAIPDPGFDHLRVETLHRIGDAHLLLNANFDVLKVQLDSVPARGDMECDTRELDIVQTADGR
ncbi:MAG: hypothetical protein ACK57B_03335 [Betaproteobacteria bacterium]|jgi:hypothetical protein